MVTRSEIGWDMGLEEVAALATMDWTIPRGISFFLSDRGIFEVVGIEFPCEVLVEPSVRLGVSQFPGVGETIQEVGRCNRPPCLRNRFFPKSVHPARLGGRRLGEAQCEGWMDLGE